LSCVLGRARRLLDEIAMLEHACELDDALELELAPAASYGRSQNVTPRRGGGGSRLDYCQNRPDSIVDAVDGLSQAGAVKVRDLIRLLEDDGWELVRTRGSHRQFKHATKRSIVTVAGNLGLDVPQGTLRKILKHAGLNRPRSVDAIRSGD
jgi:predicted RNA binding protein YcfA (HicA-like mRNA interferase family)